MSFSWWRRGVQCVLAFAKSVAQHFHFCSTTRCIAIYVCIIKSSCIIGGLCWMDMLPLYGCNWTCDVAACMRNKYLSSGRRKGLWVSRWHYRIRVVRYTQKLDQVGYLLLAGPYFYMTWESACRSAHTLQNSLGPSLRHWLPLAMMYGLVLMLNWISDHIPGLARPKSHMA